MAYKHDIFVSYAEADDEPLQEADEGWIAALVSSLKPLLAQKLKTKGKFFIQGAPRLPELLQLELDRKIVAFLVSLPGLHDSDSWRAFISHAGLDASLQRQINFSGPASQFFELLVLLLKDYGKLEDGRNALEAIIEAAKGYVGQDRRAYCDTLIQDLSSHANAEQEAARILSVLESSATVLIVLSKAYLASTWRQNPNNPFWERVRGLAEVGSRVFVVEREKIDYDERPSECADSPSYSFWIEEEVGKPLRILDMGDCRYHNLLDELSQDLQKTLQNLKRPPILIHKEPSKASDGHPVVFLALNFDDLRRLRKEVEANLLKSNVRVLPAKDLPSEPQAFRKAVRADLAQSDLFVQLLSDDPGWNPSDLPEGFARCQYDLAREMEKDVLQWRSPELDVEVIQDPKLKDILQLDTVSFEDIEEFQDKIIARAFRKISAPEEENALFVFVDAHEMDKPLTQKIERVLKEYGAEYALPPKSPDPGENEKIFQQLVLDCDVLILVYGNAAQNWVYGQALNIRKIKAHRECKHKLSSAVYIGPPPPKPEFPLKLSWLHILECQEKDFDEWRLRNFIESRSGGRV